MPQMMPMFWFLLMLYFIMIFLLIMMLMNFMKLNLNKFSLLTNYKNINNLIIKMLNKCF